MYIVGSVWPNWLYCIAIVVSAAVLAGERNNTDNESTISLFGFLAQLFLVVAANDTAPLRGPPM